MRPVSTYLPLACLLLTSLVLSGCCGILGSDQPNGLELSVSERLDPSVNIFVLDSDQKRITSIENYNVFFPQQNGLPDGTEYGFRVMKMDGSLIMPVYEAFKAKSLEQIGRDGMETGNRYYHDLQGGDYVLELLTIDSDKGTVVARMNLSSITQESQIEGKIDAVRLACANVTNISTNANEDENRSYRSSMANCAADAAVSLNDPGICDMIYAAFNVPNLQDDCIMEYVYSTGDISACDKTSMPKVRGFCRAKATKDWTECVKITCDVSCSIEDLDTQKDLCTLWYATENGNVSLCEEVKSSNYKDICVNMLTQSQ